MKTRLILSLLAALLFISGAFAIPEEEQTTPAETFFPDDAEPVACPGAGTDGMEDAILLWRGFYHEWDERNHRMNRLGSYIEDIDCSTSPCSGTLVHAASSGLDSDQANYSIYYSKVAANGMGMKAGEVEFVLDGEENGVIHVVREIQITATGNLQGRDKYLVLLNGFDLCATDEAKKPITFYVHARDEHYDPDTGTINFFLDLWLNVDCDTAEGIECIYNHEDVTYDVMVGYVVFAGDESVYFTRKEFSRYYEWEKSEIIEMEAIEGSITGDAKITYPEATVGFKKILFDLENLGGGLRVNDEGHWFIEWDMVVRRTGYTASTGVADLSVELLFKQHNGYVLFSYRNAGNAFANVEVALIQFRDATISHNKTSNILDCDSDCRNYPCTSHAESTHNISFSY